MPKRAASALSPAPRWRRGAMLLPAPTNTSGMEVRRCALDADAHVARTANGARLVERHLDAADVELCDHDAGDAFSQGLDQLEAGALDELDQPLRHRLVVERVLDAVGGRRAPDVGGDLEVDADGLADAPFPVVNADHRLDPQVVEKNRVHHGPQLAGAAPGAAPEVAAPPPGGRRVSRSHRACASMDDGALSPAARRSIPA